MSTTINNIYSRVQAQIGDLAFKAIQRAEYVDFAEQIIRECAQEWKIWWVRKVYQPVPDPITEFALDTDRDPGYTIQASDVGKIFFVTETLKYWTVRPDLSWMETDLNTALLFADRDGDVGRLLRVSKGAFESPEVSLEAILSGHYASATAQNAWPFNNADTLSGVEFHSMKHGNDDVAIRFAAPIDTGEIVTVDYLMDNPYALVTMDDTHFIPGFIEDTLYYGILSRAAERLFYQGNDRAQIMMQDARGQYVQKRNQVAARTYGFMDERSAPRMRAYRWLSEDYWDEY